MPSSPPSPEPPDRTERLTQWVAQFMARPTVRLATAFYKRHERYTPLTFFFGGVVFDAFTLRRIDAAVDNALLFGYLVLLGALLLTTVLHAYGKLDGPGWLLRLSDWYPAAIQFFLGALFSAYVIFYSQSASFSETAVYLLVLVGLLIANEFIHQREVDLYILFALYYLACASFFIFFIPVITKQLGYGTFMAGTALSLAWVGAMLGFLHWRGVFAKAWQFAGAIGLVLALFGLLHLFYLQNWIPPVPLSMRDGGIYHHVARVGDDYVLRYERPPWYAIGVRSDTDFAYAPDDTVFCFTAIFAPTEIETGVYHAWSHYDEDRQDWTQTDSIGYELRGGRDNGYRGYTFKQHIEPGRWRVEVRTTRGRILGRLRFHVSPTTPRARAWKTVRYQ